MEDLRGAVEHVGAQMAGHFEELRQSQHHVQQQIQQMQEQIRQVQEQVDRALRQQTKARARPDGSSSSSSRLRRDRRAALVLEVLLEHPAVASDQAVLCRLLASSRQVAELAERRCAGRVDARLCLTGVWQVEAAVPWLERRVGLLRSLAVRPFFSSPYRAYENEQVCRALASCLRRAEQLAPGSLSRLRSFTWKGCDCAEPELLRALAPASGALTRLELSAYHPATWSGTFSTGALAQLSGLRHLELHTTDECERFDNAGTLLAGLRRLTCFVCRGADIGTWDLLRLPATLEHLEVEVDRCVVTSNVNGSVLDLGHLTCLTELSTGGMPLHQGAVLPPSLVKLSTLYPESLEPLLRLMALRRLETDMTIEQCVELARRLPTLQDVCGCGWEADEGALATLPVCTPVRIFGSLELGPEPGTLLQHVSGLTGLTALSLTWIREVGLGQVALALGALSQLRKLDLEFACIDGNHGGNVGAAAAAAALCSSQAQLLRTAAQLPELRSFSCGGKVSEGAFAELSAAVRLTHLSLTSCAFVWDVALVPVLVALTALERLEFPHEYLFRLHVPCDAFVESMCRLRRLRVLKDAPRHLREQLWVSLPELVELLSTEYPDGSW